MSNLDIRSKDLRRLVLQMVEVDGRGHIGPALSLIEILRVLYDNFLSYDNNNPLWNNRDRLILSKGHGCMALYAILADKGFFEKKELSTFCKPNSRLGGHPEMRKLPGVEATTGSLGHGFSIGVGMAIAAKIRKQNHRVVVIVGDGEINEGSVWEAALSASKHKLNNLVLFIDYNKLQSYGATSDVLNLEPLVDKWRSFNFLVEEVDGHNVQDLQKLTNRLLPDISERPTVVICQTTKGKGLPFAENNNEWHHKSNISVAEIKSMYEYLN